MKNVYEIKNKQICEWDLSTKIYEKKNSRINQFYNIFPPLYNVANYKLKKKKKRVMCTFESNK